MIQYRFIVFRTSMLVLLLVHVMLPMVMLVVVVVVGVAVLYQRLSLISACKNYY